MAASVLAFFLLSAWPIGFQWGAEIIRPTPEGTWNGLLLLMGQISGITFISDTDAMKDPLTGSMTLSLLILIGLQVLCLLVGARLHELQMLQG